MPEHISCRSQQVFNLGDVPVTIERLPDENVGRESIGEGGLERHGHGSGGAPRHENALMVDLANEIDHVQKEG